MSGILENCIITLDDSEVVKEYYFSADGKEYHTGIDIKAKEVYCPCKGVVIQKCLVDGHPSIIIQYSEHIALKFSHLKTCDLEDGQVVSDNECIGTADKYVHFEYLTNADNDPLIRVYIMPGVALYMHDPKLVLYGNIQFDHSSVPQGYDRDEILEAYEDYVSHLSGEALDEALNPEMDYTPWIMMSDLFEDLK